MLSENLLSQIRFKNRLKNGNFRKLKKPPKWLYPKSIERQYRKELFELTSRLRQLINDILIPELPNLINESVLSAKLDRRDDFISDLKRILIHIRSSIQPKVEETKKESEQIGIQIARYNNGQFNKIVESVFEINIFESQPWLLDQLRLFSSQNSELIQSLTDLEIERVSGIVQRGFQNGSHFKEIAKDIRQSFGITHRRANTIARDQVSKLNASLSRLQQQNLGIDEFEWSTSLDERVRHSHKVLEGKICKFSDPTVYREKNSTKWLKRSSIRATQTQVGEDVNCRCVAIGLLEGILDG